MRTFAFPLILFALASGLHPQQPRDGTTVLFEVASVKPSAPGDGRTSVSSSPSGLYSAVNIPLRLLIRNAFGLQLDQLLVGGPEWIDGARYDISARAEISRPTTDHRRQMLQALLAERFKLSTRSEARDLEVYALVKARSDGTLGPRLRPSTVDCDELAARMTRGEGPVRPASDPPLHGMRMQSGLLQVGCMPLTVLVSTLVTTVTRPVIDRTGLGGNFDLELEWNAQRSGDANLPNIFTAVQEQLGLKLEPQRALVDVVVIDRIERPSPD